MEIGVTQTSSGKLSVVNESAGNNHGWPVSRNQMDASGVGCPLCLRGVGRLLAFEGKPPPILGGSILRVIAAYTIKVAESARKKRSWA